jgi:Flp pilus assembly protein protease CpaA
MSALGLSLFLIAVGAVLAFAVNTTVTGLDIATVGVILMAVGFIGLLLSLLFWTSFSPMGGGRRREYREIDVDDGPRVGP